MGARQRALVGVLAFTGLVAAVGACTSGDDDGGEQEAAPSTTTREAAAVDPHFASFEPCDDERLPEPWMCTTLDVPLDRADPSAGTITLQVMGRPHTGDTEGLPLFTTPGGPGAEGLETYALWKLPELVDENHDVVTIDPRGTGRSAPIDCPAAQAASPTIEAHVAAGVECGAQLGDASARYGAADRAMDVEAVRELMGYDAIIYHGQSYSTLDVQAYAARFPDRLAAMVLDAGFAAGDPDTFLGLGLASGMMALVDATCAEDEACSTATDQASEVVGSMIEALETPLVVDGEVVADQASIALLIRDLDQAVPVTMAALWFAEGNTEPLVELVDEFDAVGVPEAGDPARYSVGANFAGWCNDDAFPFDLSDGPDVRAQKIDAALASLGADAMAPWSAAGLRAYWLMDGCTGWPSPVNHLAPVPDGTALPDVPTLLLIGELEPWPAPRAALAEMFPNAHVALVGGAGSPALSAGMCAAEYEAHFIEHLEPPPGVPCDDE